MADRLGSLLFGTGTGTWALWFALLAVLVWISLPDPSGLEVGLFAGFFVAIRLELNALRERVRQLEREAANT